MYGSIFSYRVPGRNPRRSPASTAGRVRMMRRTSESCSAFTAVATARYVFPVPAGPIARGQHPVAEDLGRTGLRSLDQLDGLAHRGFGEHVSTLQEREQLLEQLPDLLGFAVRSRYRDLVAANQDLGIERGLHELEELVALPQEGDHRLVARDED